MLSRRPRSRAIPGRGIWAGLALTPILIALVALIVSSLVGGAATARPTAGTGATGPVVAKARVRPTITRAESASITRSFWTAARKSQATDVLTGRHAPDVGTGPPHTSFNWYPDFPKRPAWRAVLLYYTQLCPAGATSCTPGNPTEHVCSGAMIGWDDPNTVAVEGPKNVVWTAGRCVHQGNNAESGWSDSIMGCPIHTGTGPFATGAPSNSGLNVGCWVWNSESTTPEWYADNWESRDYGVIFFQKHRTAGPCNPNCVKLTDCDMAECPTNAGLAPGTMTLCDESSLAGHTPRTQCAYNLPRAQHWWTVGFHNPNTIATAVTPQPPPIGTNLRCNWPPTITTHLCLRQGPRVTQAQFASTHAALAANPAPAAADTGPLVNTIGAYQQAGLDAGRLGPGQCVTQYGSAEPVIQQPPCTGSYTGAAWVLGSGWNSNEGRFGSVRLNSNTSYADSGLDDLPNKGIGYYGGSMQGPYFDTTTCFDYQAWTGWTGVCA